ncbi:hypothetical protein KX729_09205 [Rhizobium sp. XQZ8]|uniref:hypothetical protein n=1 Tax=Rhizobium populisoli TaxID=2859785 RepID=UPI001CA52AE3|nr:hypothetical protein [Rhizobium populisoli]MBW6421616.1 hypothetical protein [Rhizobium populisoli]
MAKATTPVSAKDRLKARLTPPPSKSAGPQDRIKALIEEAQKQIEALDRLAKLKTADEQRKAIIPQASWIKVTDHNKFVIKIGRLGFPFFGEEDKHFKADGVDEAKEIINDIKDLAREDEEFQNAIRAYKPTPKSGTIVK